MEDRNIPILDEITKHEKPFWYKIKLKMIKVIFK